MSDFWNLIVQSNTFNFAILVVIIAIVFAKINLPEIIENIRSEVSRAIENAKLEKQNAEKELKSAKNAVKNTDTEVQQKLDGAKQNVNNLTNEIMKNTQEQIKHIEKNVERVISAEEKKLSTKLMQETIQQSIELAKQNIINRLDKDLHEKFIDDSINELDRVKL